MARATHRVERTGERELTLERGSFDDATACLLAWRASKLVPVQLALHENVSIPWSPGPTGLL